MLELVHAQVGARSLLCEGARGAVNGVADGNGLEAMTQLMNMYEQRTAMTKRAHLETIITNTPAMKVEDLEGNLQRL